MLIKCLNKINLQYCLYISEQLVYAGGSQTFVGGPS